MIWLVGIAVCLLAILCWDLSAEARATRVTIIAASDLNLQAHTTLLEKVEEIERHLSQMPKVRWDP